MSTQLKGTVSRPASAWFRALCVLCTLVVAAGVAFAADPSRAERGAIVERDGATSDLSQFIATRAEAAPSVNDTRTPSVAGCPITVLPNNAGTSGNERAPSASFTGGRTVYLITAAELAANGFASGTVPSGIGWNYSTGPGATATGTLVVYMQNTADVTNLKSTTWATAITGMTVVHNASTTLPAAAGTFDIAFSGGSPFTYTGGGLYIAFDWSWAGPATGAAVVLCNTALTNGLLGANSQAATVAASSFRPETRLTPSVATVFNDASVDYVISYGALPVSLIGPQTVKAVITNRGVNPISGLPVTLNITGANSYTNLQVIAGPIASCGGVATVTFAPYTPTATGSDTVAVSVPTDDVSGNNSKTRPLTDSFNSYSYKHPGTTAAGGFGNTAAIAFAAKFNVTAAAKVTQIIPEFFSVTATTYRVGIFPDVAGSPGTVPLYLDAANRTVTATGPATITLPSPVAVGPGTFYAVVEQTNATNMSLSYDAETPIRTGSFYAAFAVPPATWADFSPLNNFKPNIGVTLIQCTTAAECNDNNVCTDDACTNGLCVHTNNSLTECDNNACSSPDACTNGVCIPGPNPCNDNNACTIDLCAGGGGCTYNPVNCDDNNPCTNDSCDPQTGCVHVNNTLPCTDNNPCTIGDVCSGGACLPGAVPQAVQFCNQNAVSIPTSGIATPYPASIVVSGVPTYLCKLTVNLNGFTHTYPSDVDIELARSAPTTPNALILSDAGGSTPVSGVNLTLDDAAATQVPAVIVSGTFQPTNVGTGDTMPAPAPAPSGGSALSQFIGSNPNVTWNLWVNDQFTPDSGTITSWCVNVIAICGSDADCADNNPCTTDACVNGSCTHVNNTAACDDGNVCTVNDTCANGACVGTAGNEGGACNDNSLCTSPDACQNGVCVGQNPVVCTPDANQCTTEACDPATGQCISVNNNNPCDDGNPCTTGDACGPAIAFSENFDGVTAPALPAGWAASGTGTAWATSTLSADTPPNSAFGTDGAAVADEVLDTPPINIVTPTATLSFRNAWSFESTTTTSCFDGGVLEIKIGAGAFTDIVTAGGSFVSGGYTGIVSSSFSNPLAARNAWCNNSPGYPGYVTTLVNLPAAAAGQSIQLRWRIGTDTSVGAPGQNIDGIAIYDGANVCNPGTGVNACDDNNPCTDDYCDAQLGGCQHAPNNADCDDNNACTILDTCNNGTCGGTVISCNDSNPCTTDTCDTGSGCVFTANTDPCSDGNACTTGDTCGNGFCNPGAAVVCNDNNACTTDSCNVLTGCVFANNTNPCSDGNACTQGDVCGGGTCHPGAAVVCNDNNGCTNDSCDQVLGCVFAPNTNACDDGNPCTVGDVCGNGACVPGTLITPPAEAQGVGVAADKTTYSWSAVPSATQYDVVRGSLAAFPVGPGGADETCFDNLGGPSLSDGTVPGPNSGFWYLSRGENACGNGTYGTQGVNGAPGAPRVTTTCP